jgi:hypothetical protein
MPLRIVCRDNGGTNHGGSNKAIREVLSTSSAASYSALYSSLSYKMLVDSSSAVCAEATVTKNGFLVDLTYYCCRLCCLCFLNPAFFLYHQCLDLLLVVWKDHYLALQCVPLCCNLHSKQFFCVD